MLTLWFKVTAEDDEGVRVMELEKSRGTWSWPDAQRWLYDHVREETVERNEGNVSWGDRKTASREDRRRVNVLSSCSSLRLGSVYSPLPHVTANQRRCILKLLPNQKHELRSEVREIQTGLISAQSDPPPSRPSTRSHLQLFSSSLSLHRPSSHASFSSHVFLPSSPL